MTRVRNLALAAILSVIAPVVLVTGSALADEAPLEVGTELMATSDVSLHQAEIAKGSRVSVTKITRSREQVDAVNVALADGHVVKVTIAQVHTYFRVCE